MYYNCATKQEQKDAEILINHKDFSALYIFPESGMLALNKNQDDQSWKLPELFQGKGTHVIAPLHRSVCDFNTTQKNQYYETFVQPFHYAITGIIEKMKLIQDKLFIVVCLVNTENNIVADGKYAYQFFKEYEQKSIDCEWKKLEEQNVHVTIAKLPLPSSGK